MDVAAVAEAFLKLPAQGLLIEQLGRAWQLDSGPTAGWAAFLAGLHDIGKANGAFQSQRPQTHGLLMKAGIVTSSRIAPHERPKHATVSWYVLRTLLCEANRPWKDLSQVAADTVAHTLGGHHGLFPTDLREVRGQLRRESEVWRDVRTTLADDLASLFPELATVAPQTTPDDNAAVILLAGLTTLADWIASNTRHFPYLAGEMDASDYYAIAQARANEALRITGWGIHAVPQRQATCSDLFGFPKPRPLQVAIEALIQGPPIPRLVIIEAPMGEGKTEAAMLLQQAWQQKLAQRGCYFALPTMATSNQMFQRIEAFLRHAFPESGAELHLLHSHALLSDQYHNLRPSDIDRDGENNGDITAHEWFMRRKRGLLAPFAVGTVDQALMAVLQTKHGYLRLFGLANKTIIFDEVHAYDTYMLTLFQRLMAWLGSLGCTVAVLSATLPRERTRSLVSNFAGQEVQVDWAPYPRITSFLSDGHINCEPIEVSQRQRKRIALRWYAADIATLAAELEEVLKEGGCVAWICNTVKRAQDTYSELTQFLADVEIELDLLHARYPFREREEREKRSLRRYGPSGERPTRSILVSTQIIEQSLDLDFDLMISELAPADLVIQRSGRLHRHERERPSRLRDPRLWLIEPTLDDHELPAESLPYPLHLIARSWLVLRDRGHIDIPGDLERIVEAVYGHETPTASPAQIDRLAALRKAFEAKQSKYSFHARTIEICHPETGSILVAPNRELQEDRPEVHPTLQALTRIQSYPTVDCICLHEHEERLYLDADHTLPVELKEIPSLEQAKRLIGNGVAIPDWGDLAGHLEEPARWAKNGVLRYKRLARFVDGVCGTPRRQLTWHPELGIVTTWNKEDITDDTDL